MQVNGKELAVEITGEGPVVLLVHGLGGTSNFYQPQVAALAERFTVVRPDMEGSGRSTGPRPLTIEGFANDLADLIKTLDAGPARVVGHSMGDHHRPAALAATRPELVSHLALLGAVPAPLPEAGQQGQHDRAAKARAEDMAAIADAVMTNATAEATRRDHPATAAFVRELVLRQDPEGYARSCEALAGAHRPRTRSTRTCRCCCSPARTTASGRPAISAGLARRPRLRDPRRPRRLRALDRAREARTRSPSTSSSSSDPHHQPRRRGARHEQGPVPQRLHPRLHRSRPVPRRRPRRGRPHRRGRHRRPVPRRGRPASSRGAGAP